MKRNLVVLTVIVGMALTLTGCDLFKTVQPNEVAVLVDGGKISECRVSGMHYAWGVFEGFRTISGGMVSYTTKDSSVATKDTQIVGVTVTVQVSRKIDCDSAKTFLIKFPNLLNDEQLTATLSSVTTQSIKNSVRDHTLDALLSDRDGMANAIKEDLTLVAKEYNVVIGLVSVNDIALDPQYEAKLKEKALLQVQLDAAVKQREIITQDGSNKKLAETAKGDALTAQLENEKRQTAIDLEVAARQNAVAAEKAKVYKLSPEALELERLRLFAEVMKNAKATFFIPEGTTLNAFIDSQAGNIVPVPTSK